MSRHEDVMDARREVERIMTSPRTTDVEAAFMHLSLIGYTDAEICRHFEWSTNRAQTIKGQLRAKWGVAP
jgi:hypothetical protein